MQQCQISIKFSKCMLSIFCTYYRSVTIIHKTSNSHWTTLGTGPLQSTGDGMNDFLGTFEFHKWVGKDWKAYIFKRNYYFYCGKEHIMWDLIS